MAANFRPALLLATLTLGATAVSWTPTAAAEPPEDPPGVRAKWCGLRVGGIDSK